MILSEDVNRIGINKLGEHVFDYALNTQEKLALERNVKKDTFVTYKGEVYYVNSVNFRMSFVPPHHLTLRLKKVGEPDGLETT